MIDHLNGNRTVIVDATIVRVVACPVPRNLSIDCAIECHETLARLDIIERNHIVWNAITHDVQVGNGERNRPSGRGDGAIIASGIQSSPGHGKTYRYAGC